MENRFLLELQVTQDVREAAEKMNLKVNVIGIGILLMGIRDKALIDLAGYIEFIKKNQPDRAGMMAADIVHDLKWLRQKKESFDSKTSGYGRFFTGIKRKGRSEGGSALEGKNITKGGLMPAL